jgi:hypothetical protein
MSYTTNFKAQLASRRTTNVGLQIDKRTANSFNQIHEISYCKATDFITSYVREL